MQLTNVCSDAPMLLVDAIEVTIKILPLLIDGEFVGFPLRDDSQIINPVLDSMQYNLLADTAYTFPLSYAGYADTLSPSGVDQIFSPVSEATLYRFPSLAVKNILPGLLMGLIFTLLNF